MAFEQPGVANIRERKARRQEEWLREMDDTPPPKGSIAHLIWTARQKETPEELEARQEAARERLRQYDLDYIARHRCSECGADTINYSHSFRCPRRGSGF